MADETEQSTLQDLFRVIKDMRAEQKDMRGEMNARFEQVDARFDEASAERQAIRDVVDALPSEEDFQELDRKVAVVANDTKATRTDSRNLKAEVSRLRSDVKAAGIPVR